MNKCVICQKEIILYQYVTPNIDEKFHYNCQDCNISVRLNNDYDIISIDVWVLNKGVIYFIENKNTSSFDTYGFNNQLIEHINNLNDFCNFIKMMKVLR